MRTADVVIVGAGIVGLSIARNLLDREPLRLVVLEKEQRAGLGATAQATGGIRHQFSTAAHVRLTQLSYDEFSTFRERTGQDIGFRAHGYLMLTAQEAMWEAMRRAAELQRGFGVPVRKLAPREASALVPQLRIDDLQGGTFCGLDGSANPSDVLQAYLREVRERGGEIRFGERVVGINVRAGKVRSVRTERDEIGAPIVIDAAGPYAAEIAALAGIDLPARPFRRQVFTAAPLPDLPPDLPFTIDLDTGWYLHQDASGALLLGGTDKDARPGLEPVVDWDGFDVVAAAAMRRMPGIAERVQIKSAYAGIRTLTPDYHPILGRVREPEGFVCATACNGHGFMHAPAVGLLLAEEVLDGRAHTMDLHPLRLERFEEVAREREAVMF